MDADKDGFITKDELRSAAREFRGRHRSRLREMDADADGNISRSEWKGKEEIFNRLDANNDGLLSRDELRGMRQRRGPDSRRSDQSVRRRCEREQGRSGARPDPCEVSRKGSAGVSSQQSFKADVEQSGYPVIWKRASGEHASCRSSQLVARRTRCSRARTILAPRIHGASARECT